MIHTKESNQTLLREVERDSYQVPQRVIGTAWLDGQQTNELIVEDSHDERLLAKAILGLIPPSVVGLAIHRVFGLGAKPTTRQRMALNRFRSSDKASLLYALWKGKDYQPVREAIPLARHHYNSPLVVYLPQH